MERQGADLCALQDVKFVFYFPLIFLLRFFQNLLLTFFPDPFFP